MSSTVTHEIKRFARCISAHTDANESYHGFLVSTANLRGPNEIRLLRYREDGEELRCVALWSHDYEVLSLNGCPTDGSLLSTVYNTLDGKGGKGTVWRLAELPEGLGGEDSGGAGLSGGQDPLGRALERVCDLTLAAGGGGSGEAASPSAAEGVDPLHHLQWAPAAQDHKAGTMVSAHSGSVRCWSLDNGKAAETWCVKFEAEASFLGGVAWDPHHPVEVSVATDGDVSSWDMRTGEKTRSIAAVAATTGCIRGLSYNPNKPWHLATCGDDFRVKIWDLRRCAAPIKILDGHSHWATCVAFNPFHDQLLLSGGADSRVDLWRVSSVSSAPLLELGEEEEGGAGGLEDFAVGSAAPAKHQEPRMASDTAVKVHLDHTDSVTGIAWSSTGAWVYASVSYTGRVAINTVPAAEKYRVLL